MHFNYLLLVSRLIYSPFVLPPFFFFPKHIFCHTFSNKKLFQNASFPKIGAKQGHNIFAISFVISMFLLATDLICFCPEVHQRNSILSWLVSTSTKDREQEKVTSYTKHNDIGIINTSCYILLLQIFFWTWNCAIEFSHTK